MLYVRNSRYEISWKRMQHGGLSCIEKQYAKTGPTSSSLHYMQYNDALPEGQRIPRRILARSSNVQGEER